MFFIKSSCSWVEFLFLPKHTLRNTGSFCVIFVMLDASTEYADLGLWLQAAAFSEGSLQHCAVHWTSETESHVRE